MLPAAVVLIAFPIVLVGYAYAGYPALLWLLAALRRSRRAVPGNGTEEWPTISIAVPVYNEERQAAALVESLLALDYPADRRQILIVSDASDDRTDEIVAGYRDRGVELLRLPERGGKTVAENAARGLLRGEIVVNTDASIRIPPQALKPLIAAFADPTVGVASGRDVSRPVGDDRANVGESGYVGYEMWIRDLETRLHGIVGASGCFYAIRRELHGNLVPAALSRDFAAALGARERGYRAVSVHEAVCFVPRVPSLRREYARKVRTMTRGLETLFYKAKLMNPFRHGVFAWMLVSHKLCRWLVPWSLVAGLAGLALMAVAVPAARWLLAPCALAAAFAWIGWRWPEGRTIPRVFAVPAFVVLSNIAALKAWVRALRGELDPIWEPTRREAAPTAAGR